MRQGKPLALLCYLSHEQRFVSRSTLLGLFWPELSEERGRAALRKAVFLVRRGLDEEAIGNQGDRVGVAADRLWCDTVEFREAIRAGDLVRALDLYQGDLLPGFHLSHAPEFERWLETERSWLRNMAEKAALRLGQQALEGGAWEEALRWSGRAGAVSSHSEEGTYLAITALHRLGDDNRALEQYERYAHELKTEYGTTPSARVRDLASAIGSSGSAREGTVQVQGGSGGFHDRFVESATDIMYQVNVRGHFTAVNAAASRVMGYPREKLLGTYYLDLVREDCRDAMLAFYVRQVAERTPSTYYEFPAVCSNGRVVWLGQNVQPLEEEGEVTGLQAVARDITTQVRMAEVQRSLAIRDRETELYSPRGLHSLAEDRIRLARRTRHKLVLLCLDVQGLEKVGTSRPLVEVARLLESTFRASDVVARLGDHRFAVLALERVETDDAEWCSAVSRRLCRNASDSAFPPGLTLTAGIAYSGPPEGCTAQQLLSLSTLSAVAVQTWIPQGASAP